MIKVKALPVITVFFLVACAQQQPVKTMPAPQILAEEQPRPTQRSEPELHQPQLPKQNLKKDVLYKFLLAEIAGQRGRLKDATREYMDLAKSTSDPRLAQRATELSLYAQDKASALSAARLWAKLDPKSLPAQQITTALLVNNNKLEEARPHLEQLLANEQKNVGQNFLQLNNLFAKHTDKAGVLNLVKELAKPYPTLAEAHFAISQAALNAGQLELALSEIKEAQRLRPEWEAPVQFHAQLLQKQSNKAAITFLQNYLSTHPQAKDVRLSLARLLVSEKNYAQARTEFKKLTNDFPSNPDVALAVGLLSFQLNDFDEADKQLRRVLDLGYKDPDSVRLYLGQLNEQHKRYEQAREWYGSVDAPEHYLSAQIHIADLIAKQGKLAEARIYLRQIQVTDNDQRIAIAQAEGQLLRDAKQYQDAFDVLGKALEQYPRSPELLYDYAMAAEKLNRLDVMETSIRKLIQIKPDNAHAYNALGYTLADRTNRLSEAVELLNKALKLAPDDPFILDSMGWAQFRLGNLEQGVTYLKRAFATRPDPEIAAHLGEVLWAQGKYEDAEKVWQSSLKENPDNEVLRAVIKKFAGQVHNNSSRNGSH